MTKKQGSKNLFLCCCFFGVSDRRGRCDQRLRRHRNRFVLAEFTLRPVCRILDFSFNTG